MGGVTPLQATFERIEQISISCERCREQMLDYLLEEIKQPAGQKHVLQLTSIQTRVNILMNGQRKLCNICRQKYDVIFQRNLHRTHVLGSSACSSYKRCESSL
jgi:hypothetical protein